MLMSKNVNNDVSKDSPIYMKISRRHLAEYRKKYNPRRIRISLPLPRVDKENMKCVHVILFGYRNKAHDIGQMKVAIHMEAYT